MSKTMPESPFASFRPPLPEELLLTSNFFELYPHDGGGSFVHRETLGSVDDLEMAHFILQGGTLQDFGQLPQLDFLKFARWQHIEKCCWLSRMYFIVPLAKKYRLHGDENLARLVRDILLHFDRTVPAPDGLQAQIEYWREIHRRRDEEYNTKTFAEYSQNPHVIDYNWYDFQPASRLLHALHALFLIRHSPSVSTADWQQFMAFFHRHGETIFLQETHCSQPRVGNHQALRAMALLYADAACPNPKWRQLGRDLALWHLQNDYLDDGTLREISPSYHLFETWICRDAAILAKRAGNPFDANSLARLNRAVMAADTLRQPDGHSVVINDGYPVNLKPFLQTFLTLNQPPATGDNAPRALQDAGIASWNRQNSFFLIDASPFPGRFSHYHAGKNAVTLWIQGKPFLVDSACCNYDCPQFATWYKLPEAHSTLIVNQQGDAELRGTYEWQQTPTLSLDNWQTATDGRQATIRAQAQSPRWPGLHWTRTAHLPLTDDKPLQITLEDDVRSKGNDYTLQFVFVLHPDVRAAPDDNDCTLENNGVRISLRWLAQDANGKRHLQPELADGEVYQNFTRTPARRLLVNLAAQDHATLRTTFTLL